MEWRNPKDLSTVRRSDQRRLEGFTPHTPLWVSLVIWQGLSPSPKTSYFLFLSGKPLATSVLVTYCGVSPSITQSKEDGLLTVVLSLMIVFTCVVLLSSV